MIILGLNAFHADAAACLVRDGVLVAAAEEERFRRIKHWAGFPSQAIAYCLAEAGVSIGEVDHVAVNQDSHANRRQKLAYVLRRRPDLELVLGRLRNRRERDRLPELIARAFPEARVRAEFHAVEHHLAHLASAFDVSPFQEAVVVSVDGFGDFASTAWGVGRGDALSVEGRVHFPHSLGLFYQALTQYLGFPHYGDEYKVMGLAPYGEPRHLEAMRRIVRLSPDGTFELDLRYFRHHREQAAFAWDGGSPAFPDLFSETLEDLLGPRRAPDEPIEQRHHDIARSAQTMYEEAFFNLINALQAKSGLTDLALA
ncbi:MAG TPA: carbamoyltransferase N-terminal domain-containing protein, partial [Caulobacteraceae bacterium]|nr:carbamoyltransferase N-terminal domain-containing protein [Caulobacteraceae bacterium]